MKFKQWLLNEVSKEFVKQVKDATQNKDKPFENIFKGNERVILPYESLKEDDQLPLDILNKTKKNGYAIDFETGIISKDKVIPAEFLKKIKDPKPAKIQMKMGKYVLEKGNFTEEEKNWWTHQGDPIKSLEVVTNKNKYAVIISRHPIDIIRMSDHDKWTSCHAPGREYFQCAVTEAKNSGAIAYVVAKDDISKINIKDDEIFSDKDRGVSGIKPLSRLRIRLFQNKKDNHELAIPEDRVYGLNLKGLQDTVRQWAFKNQEDLLQDRPKMKDYQLLGGSYQDTTASELFNKFFGDDEDRGQADYAGEEDEFESMFQTYRNEAEQIYQQYNNESIASFSYDVEGDDGQPYVHYSASFHFEFPNQQLLKEFNHRDEEIFRDWVNDHNFYTLSDSDVRQDKTGITVTLNLYDDGGNQDPDSFGDFCEYITKEIKNKENDLHNSIYYILVKNEFLAPSYTMNKISEIETDQEDEDPKHELNNLKNFQVVVDSSGKINSTGMTFTTKKSITIAEFKETNAKQPEEFETTVNTISKLITNKLKLEIWNVIGAFFKKIEDYEKSQLKLFKEPEFQIKTPTSDNSRAYTDISLKTNIDPYLPIKNFKGEPQRSDWNKPPTANIKLTFNLPINNLDSDDKTNEVIDMITMMDKSFESLKSQIIKTADTVIHPYMQKYFNV